MELTKKEELVALSSAMYLMGLGIEASRLKLELSEAKREIFKLTTKK